MEKNNYELWLEKTANDSVLNDELKSIGSLPDEINDRFYRELSFGTGGMRGKLGAGINRMNVFTVGRATLGFADYLLSEGEKSICVAYDSRNMSSEFARIAAKIMSSKNISVYLFDTLMPTPVLSYAVRKLNAGGGIVITASHNPKEYNGYKVYNSLGCQVTDEAAAKITNFIDKHDYFENYSAKPELIKLIGEDVLNDFIDEIYNYSLPFDKEFLPSIVYTPLNGTGLVPVEKMFRKIGVENYTVVPEQKYPDGNFTTCPFPNPEEKPALKKALETAEKTGAELVIATDPDADRVGIAYREENGEYRLFNGNETGVLMENFILSVKKKENAIPANSYIVSTIVTTPLTEKIAESFGVETVNVLTGFKYIGEAIDKRKDKHFLFGLEESYGYLVGTHARDKDSISAVMIITEMVCYYKSKGLSLSAALNEIYSEYGYYVSGLYSKYFEGEKGMSFMSEFMDKLRRNPPKEVCGETVTAIKDYSLGIDGLPKSNVMVFKGENFSLIARPSGTEPKLKFYVTAWNNDKNSADSLAEKIIEYVKNSI